MKPLLDRETRLRNLEAAFNQKIDSLVDHTVSKKDARDAETERLRAEARATGKPEIQVQQEQAKNSPNLHWDPTIDQYRNSAHRFCEWLVDNHPEAETINYIHRKKYAAEYLKAQYSSNVGTMKTNRSQLAKAIGVPGEKLLEIKEKRPMPTKGRDFDPIASPIADAKKYGDTLPTLGRATGARLEEVPNLTKSCFYFKGGQLFCHYDGKWQNTKGARDRDSLVPQVYEKQILAMIKDLKPNQPIIAKVPDGYNEHAYRRLYAAELKKELSRPLSFLEGMYVNIKPKHDYKRGTVRTTAPAILHSTLRNMDLDRWAMGEISGYLGHGNGRVDLVVKNYGDYF